MDSADWTTQTRAKRVEAMMADLVGIIPDHRRKYIESLVGPGDKKVETMIADFLDLIPELRRVYIDLLSDLLYNRNHLYPNRQSRYTSENYASDEQTPAASAR